MRTAPVALANFSVTPGRFHPALAPRRIIHPTTPSYSNDPRRDKRNKFLRSTSSQLHPYKNNAFDRIFTPQVVQAQTGPAAGGPGPGGRRQGRTCITDQARQLRATVTSGKAFGLWLERLESKRVAERGGGAAGVAAGAAAAGGGGGGGDGEPRARPLISRGQRAAASRFKSQEHPRVVMKDLDGLEPDRVQVSGRGGFGARETGGEEAEMSSLTAAYLRPERMQALSD